VPVAYRRLPTPLHAASARAGCLYCLALAAAALMLSNPLTLGAVTLSILAAGGGRRRGRHSSARCFWRCRWR